MMTKKLCILLIKKVFAVTETRRVFRTERTVATVVTTKSVEESETATTHDKVITEMVSPSQDTNPDFPWFMTVDPTTSRPFYVKCESMESQ